ncbi:MAG: type II toxin-antitoxin system VapC family toxin [Gammaproteobacteria bacterium]
MMKKSPSPNVITWIDKQEITQLFVTTISIAEICYGLQALPEGKRRVLLQDAFNQVVNDAFKYRVLDFNELAAHQYGIIMSQRKKSGRPLSILDGQIAAIALAHRAILATRNMRDFIDCNLELINPFN